MPSLDNRNPLLCIHDFNHCIINKRFLGAWTKKHSYTPCDGGDGVFHCRCWDKRPSIACIVVFYGYLPLILKPIQITRERHAGNSWRSKNGPISDILLWTLSHGRTNIVGPSRTSLQQFSTNTGCSLEDLPEAMNYIDEWQGRVREIRVSGTAWWWGWWWWRW